MANNIDRPSGFKPISNGIAGTAPRLTEYTALTNIAIGEGDIVGINSTGLVVAYTTTDADAGDVLGVAAIPLTAANTAREIQIYDDPEQIYEAQADDSSLTITADYLFKYFPIVNTAASTLTLQSQQEIKGDSASGSLTTGDVVQVVGLGQGLQNQIGDDPANTAVQVSFTRFKCRIVPSAHIRSASAANNATPVAGIG